MAEEAQPVVPPVAAVPPVPTPAPVPPVPTPAPVPPVPTPAPVPPVPDMPPMPMKASPLELLLHALRASRKRRVSEERKIRCNCIDPL